MSVVCFVTWCGEGSCPLAVTDEGILDVARLPPLPGKDVEVGAVLGGAPAHRRL